MAVAGHLDILGHILVLGAPLSASFCLCLPTCAPPPTPLGSSCFPIATPQGPFISQMSKGESQPIQRPSGQCRVAGRGEGQLAVPDPVPRWQAGGGGQLAVLAVGFLGESGV